MATREQLTLLINGDSAGGREAVSLLIKSLGGLKTHIWDVATNGTAAFGLMGTALVAIVAGIGAAALASERQLIEADNRIRALTGKTGEELRSLTTTMRDVFAMVPDSADRVAEAVGRLHDTTEVTDSTLAALTKTVLELANVTGEDLETLIAATTRAFGDWSIATEDQIEALDYLFKTSQRSNISVSHLTELVVQFGAPLRSLNYTFEQSAAMLGKWNEDGVNTETLLSGLRAALGKFAKEGKEPAQAMRDIQAAIVGAGEGARSTTLALEVFGRRAATDMKRAILEGRFAIDDLVASIKASEETIGKADEETKTFGERFTELRHKVQLAIEPLGVALIRGLNALEPAFQTVSDLARDLGSVLGTVAGAAGKAGGVLVDAWRLVPTLFREITFTALEVAVGIWAIVAAASALGKTGVWSGLVAGIGYLKDIIRLIQVMGAGAAFRLIAANVAAPLVGLKALTASFLALGPAIGAIGGVSIGLIGALGGIAVAVGSVTAVVMAGRQAWLLYQESRERVNDAANETAMNQRVLAEAYKVADDAGKNRIATARDEAAKLAEAKKILAAYARELRESVQQGAADAKQLTEAERLATLAQDLHQQSTAKLSTGVATYARQAFAAGKSVEEVTKALQDQQLITEDHVLALKRLESGWKTGREAAQDKQQALNKIAASYIPLTAAQQDHIDRLTKEGVAETDLAKAMNVSEIAIRRHIELAKTMTDIRQATHELAVRWEADLREASRKTAERINEDLASQLATYTALRAKTALLGKTGLDLQLAQIAQAKDADIAALGYRRKGHERLYDENVRLYEALYQHQIDLATGTAATLVERMTSQGILTRADLTRTAAQMRVDYEAMRVSGLYTTEQLRQYWLRVREAEDAASSGASFFGETMQGLLQSAGALGSAFQSLAQTGGPLSGFAQYMGQTIQSMLLGRTAGKELKAGLDLGTKGLGQIAVGALSAAAALDAVTQSTNKVTNAMSGAATGASIGTSIMPGWGTAIGAMVGAIYGIWKATDNAKKMAEQMRVEWIKAAGGFAQLEAQATLAGVSLIGLWSKSGDALQAFITQTDTLIGRTLTELRNGLAQTEAVGSKAFLALVSRARELGVEVQAITGWLDAQYAAISEGAIGLVGALTEPWHKAQEEVDRLRAAIVEATDPKEVARLWKELDFVQSKLVVSQTEVDRWGRIISQAFAAALVHGSTFLGALTEFGPALDGLQTMLERTGLKASDTLKTLLGWQTFAERNPALVSAVDSLNTMMRGLWNTGMLNQGMFSDLSKTVVDVFATMTREGKGGEQGMRALQPTLQQMWQVWKDTGFVIDEATLKLLEDAEGAGIVGEKYKTEGRKQVEALEAVKKMLGELTTFFKEDFVKAIQEAFGKAEQAAVDAKLGIDRRWRKEPWADWVPPALPGGGGGTGRSGGAGGGGEGGGGGGGEVPSFDMAPALEAAVAAIPEPWASWRMPDVPALERVSLPEPWAGWQMPSVPALEAVSLPEPWSAWQKPSVDILPTVGKDLARSVEQAVTAAIAEFDRFPRQIPIPVAFPSGGGPAASVHKYPVARPSAADLLRTAAPHPASEPRQARGDPLALMSEALTRALERFQPGQALRTTLDSVSRGATARASTMATQLNLTLHSENVSLLDGRVVAQNQIEQRRTLELLHGVA